MLITLPRVMVGKGGRQPNADIAINPDYVVWAEPNGHWTNVGLSWPVIHEPVIDIPYDQFVALCNAVKEKPCPTS